jgi:hypothetical protein
LAYRLTSQLLPGLRESSYEGFRLRQKVVIVEIFLGVLLGLLAGMFLCARYLRQEISANVGPRLAHIERQLETLQTEVNLDATTRLATLSEHFEARYPRPYSPEMVPPETDT